jgi:hypothetical protein
MVYTNLYTCGYDQVHAGMYWYVLVCTDIYLPVTVYTCMYQYTQSPVSMTQYVLVCTCMFQYILVHTSIYSNFLLTNAVFPRYSIHHDTSRYMAVQGSTQKSCIPVLRRYNTVAYIPVHTGTYQHLLWFSIHQLRLSPLLDTSRYIMVHGSTRKYPKVLCTWNPGLRQ